MTEACPWSIAMKLLRFNLRDLFWLVLVAAVLFGWERTYSELYERHMTARSPWVEAEDRLDEMALALEACKSGTPARTESTCQIELAQMASEFRRMSHIST